MRLPKPPLFLVAVPVLGFFALLLVAAVIYKTRFGTSAQPRILIPQDMGRQPKFKAQADSTFFADGRVMREPVAGSVAFGAGSFGGASADPVRLKADDHFFRGYKVDAAGKPVVVKGEGAAKNLSFFAGYPAKDLLVVDGALLKVGQTKYNQNCAMCHGHDGSGEGAVNARGTALASQEPVAGAKENPTATTWVPPKNLREETYFEANYPNGQLFFTINHGSGAMAGYGAQLSEKEGWAIVAYVRALQRTAAAAGK